MSFLKPSVHDLEADSQTGLFSKRNTDPVWPHEHHLEERDNAERVRKTVAVQRWRGLLA